MFSIEKLFISILNLVKISSKLIILKELCATKVDTIVYRFVAHNSFNIINLLEIFTRFNIEINNFSIENTQDYQKKIITVTWVTKSPFQM